MLRCYSNSQEAYGHSKRDGSTGELCLSLMDILVDLLVCRHCLLHLCTLCLIPTTHDLLLLAVLRLRCHSVRAYQASQTPDS